MSQVFTATDEEYAYILSYAQAMEETPLALFRYWVEGIRDYMRIRGDASGRKEKSQVQNTKKTLPDPSLASTPVSPGISSPTKEEEEL